MCRIPGDRKREVEKPPENRSPVCTGEMQQAEPVRKNKSSSTQAVVAEPNQVGGAAGVQTKVVEVCREWQVESCGGRKRTGGSMVGQKRW